MQGKKYLHFFGPGNINLAAHRIFFILHAKLKPNTKSTKKMQYNILI